MKLLVVLAASIALCAGNVVPLIPGDNSDYVEGVSRYIWMPDGDGVPHLVDLQQPAELVIPGRNGERNVYCLFTRDNPTTPQVIAHGNADSISASNYNPNKPIKVIVHGWNSNGNSAINPTIRDAFLEVSDCNVIVVDWSRSANGWTGYTTSVRAVPSVGQGLGNFLDWLISTAGGSYDNVHLVGFSLGAHVVGNAGRTVGGRVARITGLDPAGPQFGGNSNALNADDARYVECIHTDGGFLGINDPIGEVNFYPNGGRNRQPGCWVNTCSHSRAYDLFAASVRFNHLVGRLCSDLREANRNKCSGDTLEMGNRILSKKGCSLYALSTDRSWPY